MPPSEVSSADASVAVAPAQDRRAHLPRSAGWLALWPGLCLTAAIAGLAMGLRQLPVLGSLSPLILAIILGMLFHNLVGTPAAAKAGVVFSLRRILRLAIMLLGLQLTVAQLIAVGAGGLAIVATTLFATFLFTVRLARVIGVEKGLAELIAAGTSVCGASAVVATNTVTQARDDDVAYAVACVTVFGSLSMLLYPLLQGPLGLDPHSYGLWSGSSIHEIAQVIAAAFQGGKEAGDFGTVAKLARVTMLAPLVLGLGLLARRRHTGGQEGSAAAPVPWFVLGFVAVIGVNSLGLVPVETKTWIIQANGFLLSMALAAMGLETDIRKLARKGLRPLLLGAAAWLFIAGVSLTLIKGLA